MSAFSNVNGGLASLGRKAKGPARNLCSALFHAVIKSRLTLRIFETGSPLIWAFILNALLRVSDGNSSGFDLVKAVVIDDALPEGAGGGVALLGDAVGPAGLVVVALVLAILKGSETGWVLLAGLGLAGALLPDAVLGRDEGDSCFHDLNGGSLEAVVLGCALGNIGGLVVLLSSEAELPAGLLGSALLLAVLEVGDALGVLLTSSPLIWALLFDALLGVSYGNSSGLDLVHAVMVNNALDILVSIHVLGLSEALLPAVRVVSTSVVAELKSSATTDVETTLTAGRSDSLRPRT